MGKDELKACPIHEGECLTHWNIIKHDHDLFQGECRTDCGLVYLTAHKDFYEDAKRSLFSVWNTRPNDAKAMIAEMDKIQEEYPLDHIFTDDARYTWPERWKKLREVCKQSEGSE